MKKFDVDLLGKSTFFGIEVSVLLMIIFMCLRVVLAGSEIKFALHLWEKVSENFTSRLRN